MSESLFSTYWYRVANLKPVLRDAAIISRHVYRGQARPDFGARSRLEGRAMPIYEFECDECGARFDKLQKFGDASPVSCPEGHAQVHRLFSQPAVIFKGSGFYVTDNKKSTNPAASRNGSKKEPDSSTAEAEPKPEKETNA